LSFVDDTLVALSDTVAAHDRQLHALRNALDALRVDLQAVRGTLGQAAQDEPPPPHY
jgi:SlyX protein